MKKDTENPLAEFGLTHHCDWITFFTLIKLNPGKNTDMFYKHFHDEWKNQLGSYGDKLRLLTASVTLGSADAIVVWQAKDLEAGKAVTEKVLAADECATHSSNTLASVPRWCWIAPKHEHVDGK
jgi:hypothetical protein